MAGLGRRRTVLIACLFVPAAIAQRQSFRFYGQEQGLTNLATECLYQDRSGYLWVGTQDGLFRYDGASFVPFGERDGLPGSSIESIMQAPDGVLWVAADRGVAQLQGQRFKPVPFRTHVVSAGRFGLASDASGRVYVTTASGLFAAPPPAAGSERQFNRVAGQPPGPAYGIHVDQHGVVWYGCGSAVCSVVAGEVTVFGPAEGVPHDRWDALLADQHGTVWIRSSLRLLRKDPHSDRFTPLAEPIPRISDFASLASGREGEIFVPTDDGVWEYSNGRWRGVGRTQGLVSNSTSAVLQDREGSIWIGLWGGGLARWIGRNRWESWTPAEGLNGEHVWMIARDHSGSLWVTTNNGIGQLRKDPAGRPVWRAWTEKDGIAGNKTRAIVAGPDGIIWAGSSPGGISRIDPRTETVRRYDLPHEPGSDRIWSLAFDRAGTLWVCTRAGLYHSESQGDGLVFVRQELPMGDATETVSAVLEDRQGRLWAAGMHGLARRENGHWRRFTTRDGLPTNATGFLAEAPDGSLWVGYRDRRGLSRIEIEGDRLSIQTYNRNSGLHSNQAIFVHVDRRGWVWFGTDSGVDVLRGGRWRHYDHQDGLIWDDCDTGAFAEDEDGSVWIGTSRGLAHFRPAVSETVDEGPPVEFSRFELGGKIYNASGVIQVPYSDRSLAAQLSVLTFRSEGNVVCRYRLSGLEKDWLETRQREIRFSSLPYGKFVLEAAARAGTGDWSRNPARIAFEILPPWWATAWFRAALLAWVVLMIYGLVLWRTRKLKRESARLEAAVEERTRQLRAEQKRIEQQNFEIERLLEQARQASRLKDEFLANVSHEIRTPMNGILGMVNLMLATELTSEQRESLETVDMCARALLGVLNDLLDLSKIEAGRLEISPAPFRLADVVHAACSTFSGTAQEKGIRLSWEIAPDTPEWVESDPGRIRQVLLNLVGNAVKFTHSGEIRVSASISELAGNDLEVRFAVRDTGIGIPEQSKAVIFEAFRQADGSTSRTYGGTGLGLTICSRLVQLMGGGIEVESQVGSGSEFRFWIVARRVTQKRQAETDARRTSKLAVPARPMRILLAEDNPVNQQVTTSLLRKRGHQVVVVGNGRLAVERAAEQSFDVILMDVQMPEMDGCEAARRIREQEAARGTRAPIVAMTAHAMGDAREQCLESGMDSMIVKPFDPSQLYRTIETLTAAKEPALRG